MPDLPVAEDEAAERRSSTCSSTPPSPRPAAVTRRRAMTRRARSARHADRARGRGAGRARADAARAARGRLRHRRRERGRERGRRKVDVQIGRYEWRAFHTLRADTLEGKRWQFNPGGGARFAVVVAVRSRSVNTVTTDSELARSSDLVGDRVRPRVTEPTRAALRHSSLEQPRDEVCPLRLMRARDAAG